MISFADVLVQCMKRSHVCTVSWMSQEACTHVIIIFGPALIWHIMRKAVSN